MLIKIKQDYINVLQDNLGILKYTLPDDDFNLVTSIVNAGTSGGVDGVFLNSVEYGNLCRINDECKDNMHTPYDQLP